MLPKKWRQYLCQVNTIPDLKQNPATYDNKSNVDIKYRRMWIHGIENN